MRVHASKLRAHACADDEKRKTIRRRSEPSALVIGDGEALRERRKAGEKRVSEGDVRGARGGHEKDIDDTRLADPVRAPACSIFRIV